MQSRCSRSSSPYRDMHGTTFRSVPWIPSWGWSSLGETVNEHWTASSAQSMKSVSKTMIAYHKGYTTSLVGSDVDAFTDRGGYGEMAVCGSRNQPSIPYSQGSKSGL